MSVLESLLSGCSVISSKVGALPEITPVEKHFKLYELHDYEEAARMCLDTLAESTAIRASLLDIRSKLVEEYSSEIRSTEYWNLIQSLGEKNE
jgi:glycosyltransferase involved in cell wall biosynthesis